MLSKLTVWSLPSYCTAGRTLVSAESSAVDLGPIDDKKDEAEKKEESDPEKKESKSDSATKLTDLEASALCTWLKNTLGSQRVREVRTTHRLADSPAIITDHESGALRRMLKMLVSIETK